MSCAACANSIQRTIEQLAGVIDCEVNFALEQAMVNYDPRQITLTAIQEAVVDIGYGATVLRNIEEQADIEQTNRLREQRRLRGKVLLGGCLSLFINARHDRAPRNCFAGLFYLAGKSLDSIDIGNTCPILGRN